MPVPPELEVGARVMRRPGLLANPLSGRFARRAAAMRDAATRFPGGLYREAGDPVAVGQAVDELLERGADIIIVLGGDGTLQLVLDRCFDRCAAGPPALAVVPCGSTNMTALDLGCRQPPLCVLRRLHTRLAGGGELRLVRRRVLRVQRHGLPPLRGMFFGAGIITEGVRFFRDRVRGGLTGETAAGLAVFRMLWRLLAGGGAASAPVRSRLTEDGIPAAEGNFMLILASTLDRLLLGSRPYWGVEQAPMHVTAIRHEAAHFWRRLPALIRGRASELDEPDLHSRNLRDLVVEPDCDFVLDGEIHAAGGAGAALRLDTVGPVAFAVP
jgi:hypothetical protein